MPAIDAVSTLAVTVLVVLGALLFFFMVLVTVIKAVASVNASFSAFLEK